MIYVLRYSKINTKTSKMQGFSLIEVMFACVVLLVGIVAMIDLMSGSIINSMGARDQIIASELAQEGIELVRNLRDNNFANNKKAFENNLFPNVNKDNCRIDKDSANVSSCNNGEGKKKLFYLAYYFHRIDGDNSTGSETKFQRKIGVIYDTGQSSNANSAAITSTVIWGSDFPADCGSCNASSKCVCVEDVLTDWK